MSRRARAPGAAARRRLHVFPDTLALGRALGRALDVPVVPVQQRVFPDGETLVRVEHPPGEAALLVRSLHDPNARLLEVLFAADALWRAGARRITLVAPYLPYMRQDTVFTPGEPVSQQVVGALLGAAFTRVLTVEAHLHRIRRLTEVIPVPARSLSAAPALADWVARHAPGALIVGPDAESAPWVRAVAARAGTPWVVGEKERLGPRRVRLALPALPPARRAVLVDDIASSGATLAAAVRALRRAGIARVDVAVVHALFARGALARIRRAGARRVVSCDTIPHPTNAITVVPLLAAGVA